MSIKTRAQLSGEANSRFPDNNNKEVTAERVRNHVKDLSDSAILKVGDTGIQNVLRYLSTVVISNDYDLTTKKFVIDSISAIDLTTLWNKSGNTLASRGTFGSTSGAFGWDFKVNNVLAGGVADNASWQIGNTAQIASTFISVKSTGNNNTTYAQKWINSAATDLGFLRDDGMFRATYLSATVGIFTTGDAKAIDIDNYRLEVGGIVTCNWLTGEKKDLDGTGSHNWLARLLYRSAAYAGAVAINYETLNIFGEWNIEGVFCGKHAGSGERRVINGEWNSFSADETAVPFEIDFEYTGVGGHTLTLYSASGWKGTELTIINNGSGNLTVNGGIVGVGVTLKLKSNGTVWL